MANQTLHANKAKLTKRTVDALDAPETGERIVWDTALSGFGVRVSKTGRKTYFYQGRTRAGREGKIKLGRHGQITADKARELAGHEASRLAAGIDVFEERRKAKSAESDRKAAPTVADLCDRYLSDYAEHYKRPASVAEDKSMIDRVIKPEIGRTKVADVEHDQIARMHRKLKDRPYRANRVTALCSKMFGLAVKWKLRTDNPARGVERFQEQPRERYLTMPEIERLSNVLAQHPNQQSANAVRLLLLTGARRSEVLQATWDQFDLEQGVWRKPSSHTKQKRTHHIPLSPPALQLLAGMKEKASGPYLFPNDKGDAPQKHIHKFWKAVSEQAGVSDVRLHDLRHSYASLLASAGYSLPIIGRLMGHSQPATTARYAHLLDDPLREATSRVGAVVTGQKDESAEVIPFRKEGAT